jgi:Tol biopolymer transport system component
MSPEQVRGEKVDHRSDIFSFGAVLYQMLSGRRAFRRDSAAETMHAILKEDPLDLSQTGQAIPPGLARIVHRCLQKHPAERFHSAHDLALDLEVVSPGATASVESPLDGRRHLAWAGRLAALVAALTVAALWLARSREPAPPHNPLRIKPLTSDPGGEGNPALSPDGHLVVFTRRSGTGVAELCVQQVDGGSEPLVISAENGDVYTPAWSPDGQRLAFIRHVEAEEGVPVDGVFVISALGGPTTPLATLRSPRHGLSWSPDGSLLAVSRREEAEGPSAIWLLSVESGMLQRLTKPPPTYSGDSQAQFSPDGRTLAFVRAEHFWDDDIYLVPTEGGEERRLTEDNVWTEGLAWTPDERALVFSSWRPGGMGSYNLWWVPVSGGDPELLEFGGHGQSPTTSREGARLAYTRAEMNQDIWRVGGPSASDDERRSSTRLIASTFPDLHARYSPDGQRIAFISGRSGAYEIWVCESDGENPRQLTFLDGPMAFFPAWSLDSDEIAFIAAENLFVVSASGGPARRLVTDPAIAPATSWSRDGRSIYFFSERTGRCEVWRVPAEGGEARQVTQQGGAWAFESTDGRWLHFSKSSLGGGPPGIWRIPRDGGEEVQIQNLAFGSFWALLEEGILYMRFPEPPTLELFHFATGDVSQLATPEHCCAPGISVSPDGRWVLYAGVEKWESDIMLVEGFR